MSDSDTGRTPKGRFAPGTSGNRAGRPPGKRAGHAAHLDDEDGEIARPPSRAFARSPRFDDWVNFFTGQGVLGRDKRTGGFFAPAQLSFEQLKDLWLGDDLAARAVETIPREAARQGWDLTVSDSQEGTDEDTDGMDPAELAAEVTDKMESLGADDALEVA